MQRWAWCTILHIVMRVDVRDAERVPRDGPCLFAVNHLSLLDAWLVLCVLPRPVVLTVAESWLRRRWVPFVLAPAVAIISLADDGGNSGWQGLLEAMGALRHGRAVTIMPEGAISASQLSPGLPGAAWLASEVSAPVVPVALYGHERARADWRTLRRPHLHVRFGEPITLDPSLPIGARTDLVMGAIAALLPARYRGAYAGQEVSD